MTDIQAVIPVEKYDDRAMVEHAVQKGDVLIAGARRATLVRWAKNSDGKKAVKVQLPSGAFLSLPKWDIRAVFPKHTRRVEVMLVIDLDEPADLNRVVVGGRGDEPPETWRDIIADDVRAGLGSVRGNVISTKVRAAKVEIDQ